MLTADEYVTCLDLDDPSAFAARITGDSMEPEFLEGDIVVFSPRAGWTEGDACFVRYALDGEEVTTFKRVSNDGENAALTPSNAKYEAVSVPFDCITGIWKAVLVQRRI